MDNGYNIPSIQRVQDILNSSFNWNVDEMFTSMTTHAIFGESSKNNGQSLNKIILGQEESGV